jgi:hypothetical protein
MTFTGMPRLFDPLARLRKTVGAGRCCVRCTASSSLSQSSLTAASSSEEFEIGEGKIIDAVEPLRPWLTRKAGVDRREHVCMFRYGRSEARHALRSATTVQDENGTTAPSFVDAHGQAVGEGLYDEILSIDLVRATETV